MSETNKKIMEIPKTLKLPRKIKKEIKKGVTRTIIQGFPVLAMDVVSGSTKIIHWGTAYHGSGTKAYKKACSYLRREEAKITHQKMEDERDRFYSYLCGLAGASPNYNKTCNIIPVGKII